MRVAVTYENGQIFQHFGHCAQFALYDIDNGEIVSRQVVGTDGTGHGSGHSCGSHSCGEH
ncbi:NifB/NifX family molybdenum-iron cluster-binding protein [Ruminococcus sp.]|uniref:NifB/NifX family molybdenum-iron cluster-binding protein n=1 Tax=Ruminococcus sp. TaxID=41978 RepID=UPI0034523B72|nr:hypothetical protein [Ruminococcus sp.]